MWTRALFAPLFFLATVAFAQDSKTDPKTDDPIAAQLLKDKEAYVASLDKAREDLLKGFDKLYDTVKNNKSLKIDAQLAQLEKIEAEKKAYDENGTLPALPGMKVALSEYRTAQKKAEATCKAAFDKAAKAYRDKGELKLAGTILEEMKEFLAKGAAAGTGGGTSIIIVSHLSGKVFGLQNNATDDGTKVVTADHAKTNQNLLWRTVPASDGWFYIEHVKTGMVITVTGRGNGAEAHVAKKKEGADGQLWRTAPVPNQKDAVRIVNKAGSPKVLGIDAKSKNSGARLLLWDDNDHNAEWFGFFPPK